MYEEKKFKRIKKKELVMLQLYIHTHTYKSRTTNTPSHITILSEYPKV